MAPLQIQKTHPRAGVEVRDLTQPRDTPTGPTQQRAGKWTAVAGAAPPPVGGAKVLDPLRAPGLPARLREVIDEGPELKTFVFDPIPGFRHRPGQYVELRVPGAPNDTYPANLAVASAPDQPLRLTVRGGKGMSRLLFERGAGDTVWIRGPLGTNLPLDQFRDRPLILVAGGTAITPMASIMRSEQVPPETQLFFGARDADNMLFRDEIASWPGTKHLCVDQPDPPRGYFAGNCVEALRQTEIPPDSVGFIAGPPPMMRAAVEGLRAKGLPDERIFVSIQRIENGRVVGPVLPMTDASAQAALAPPPEEAAKP